jgi:GNAT superfamily N-acetyltransferase
MTTWRWAGASSLRAIRCPSWIRSLSCFCARKGYRRRGITSVLIAAALKAAKRVGAPALEA